MTRAATSCTSAATTPRDLVVEVVSPDDPGRDFVPKRGDYAEAGIPEYWIVDPRHDTITVLALAAGSYVEHGVYSRGDTATTRHGSPLLAGLAIDVASTFDAREHDYRARPRRRDVRGARRVRPQHARVVG
jgi:Uma2 family endonuclease